MRAKEAMFAELEKEAASSRHDNSTISGISYYGQNIYHTFLHLRKSDRSTSTYVEYSVPLLFAAKIHVCLFFIGLAVFQWVTSCNVKCYDHMCNNFCGNTQCH